MDLGCNKKIKWYIVYQIYVASQSVTCIDREIV